MHKGRRKEGVEKVCDNRGRHISQISSGSKDSNEPLKSALESPTPDEGAGSLTVKLSRAVENGETDNAWHHVILAQSEVT